MRKTFCALSCVIAATLACSTASAEFIGLDFTVADPNGDVNGPGIFTGTAPSLTQTFSVGGGRSADLTVTTTGTSLGAVAIGLGANGGTQAERIGVDEDVTLVFSNFAGANLDGTLFGADNIQFQGLIAPTLATSGDFSVEGGDEFLVNGVALTATDTGTAGAPFLNFFDPFADTTYAFQNASSLVDLDPSNAVLLDLTSDASSGFFLSGVALHVKNPVVPPVPEPSSLALLGLMGIASLVRRRK